MKKTLIGVLILVFMLVLNIPKDNCLCKSLCSCSYGHCTCDKLLDVPKAPCKVPKSAKPNPQKPPVKNNPPPGKDPNPSNPGPGTDPFIPGQCPSCP